ncbi:MAG: hypothetical protein ACK4VW_02780 [Anaerolineales bacterium]
MYRPDTIMVNAVVRQGLVAAQEVIGESGLNHCLACGDPYCRFEVGEVVS